MFFDDNGDDDDDDDDDGVIQQVIFIFVVACIIYVFAYTNLQSHHEKRIIHIRFYVSFFFSFLRKKTAVIQNVMA